MSNYFITHKGMGGGFNPPGDAEHIYSIQDGYGRNAGSMSLRYALTVDYVPAVIKERILEVLEEHRGHITEEWVVSVYRHFAHCYRDTEGNETVFGKFWKNADQEESYPFEFHRAHLWITKFFPDYPVRTDLIKASLPK